ncbi:Glu-tRNA(Gln) amidotransferase subunit GatD [Nanoarchaeota archaeon]
MADANPGDKVEIKTDKETVTGILMPNEETDSVVIKMDSGYNIGIEKKKVKGMKVIEKVKAEKESKPGKIANNPKLPTIAILHTGGTIASKADYKTGGVVAMFSPEEIINMFPELAEIANIKSRLISNMFSEDMRFSHYPVMAKAIKEEIDSGVDGIILTHGTDTMTTTSAALSFIIESLNIPVIIVGSQRSSDRGSSDAGMNLICAAEFIGKTDFAGVAICMHETEEDLKCAILPGTKTRKLHTSRRDAFKAVNDTPIASVDYKTKKITFNKKDYTKKGKGNKVEIKNKFEEKVGILRAHPDLNEEEILFYKNYKGLIIEGTGLGHIAVGAPNDLCKPNLKNLEALKTLNKNKCVMTMTSQCIFGRVHSHVYTDAIEIFKAGVIPGEDMLTETAFIKLAWLLGQYPNNPEKVKELMATNLKGEISECSDVRSHL